MYKVASYCTQCRWHIDVIVDFNGQGTSHGICGRQNAEYPLHHFVYTGDEKKESNGLGAQQGPRDFGFYCTADACPTVVRIDMRPPRLTEHDQELMTNKAQLRRRFEKSRELIGEREGEAMSRSVDGPDFLDTFLRDSLNPVPGKNRIPLLNRKFGKTFWRDCDSMLTKLGFRYTVELNEEEGTEVEAWYLPQPGPQHDPFESSLRTTIEDARYELNTIILGFPENERQNVRHKPMYPVPSQGDIELLLACHDCEFVKISSKTHH
jgi:ubiquitin carboxyl-terminal hydrolase 25/28